MHGNKGFRDNTYKAVEQPCGDSDLTQFDVLEHRVTFSGHKLMSSSSKKAKVASEKQLHINYLSLKHTKYDYEHIRKIEEQNMKLKLIQQEMSNYYFNNRDKRLSVEKKMQQHGKVQTKCKTLELKQSMLQESDKTKMNCYGFAKTVELTGEKQIYENKGNEKEKTKQSHLMDLGDRIDDETLLFMYFITDVNKKYRNLSINNVIHTVPNVQKHEDVQEIVIMPSESSVFGSEGGEQYNCSFCNMKYTYRRCLVNHIKKKHKHRLK